MKLPFLAERQHPWRIEFEALSKAAGGALIFGIPLIFTMEMWWLGSTMSPARLLLFVVVALVVCTALARLSGFRSDRASIASDISQSVEAFGVAIVCVAMLLLALDRVNHDLSLAAWIGTIAVLVIPLAFGAMVGNLVFDPTVGRAADGDVPGRTPLAELLNDMGATFAGGMFVGLSIAPTGEIPMLASAMALPHILATIAFSMLAGYIIVFASGFDPSHRGGNTGGLFQGPISETILAYVVSLLASFILLWLFGQIALDDPPLWIAAEVIALSVPTTVGGAAGRLVV